MGIVRFYSAVQAAQHAAGLTDRWETDGGDQWDRQKLLEIFELQDSESPMDEELSPECFYVVDEIGSIGITDDGGSTVDWVILSKKPQKKARFCPQCGAPWDGVGQFCAVCGAPVREPRAEDRASHPASAARGGGVGFADLYSDPDILAHFEENKKSGVGCMWFFACLPLVIGIVAALVGHFTEGSDILPGILIGGGITVLLCIVSIICTVSKKNKKLEPPWEGTVVDKKEKRERDRHDSEHNHYYTRYILYVRKADGKTEKVSFINDAPQYHYFSLGDRVRFHPSLDYCEKYDRSKDRAVFCPLCKRKNPIELKRCKYCGGPLFR